LLYRLRCVLNSQVEHRGFERFVRQPILYGANGNAILMPKSGAGLAESVEKMLFASLGIILARAVFGFAATTIQPRLECDFFELAEEVPLRLDLLVRKNPNWIGVFGFVPLAQHVQQLPSQGDCAGLVIFRGELFR